MRPIEESRNDKLLCIICIYAYVYSRVSQVGLSSSYLALG